MRRGVLWMMAALGTGGPFGCGDAEERGPRVETVAPHPPPPLSGGTLLALSDGATAVMADPDRDRMWIVDLPSHTVRSEVALDSGDEPGRLVEDASGRVHVVLRRSGAVGVLDVANGEVVEKRAVCPAPRGIAYDAAAGAIHVACETGELVTLDAAAGALLRTLHLDLDLRDVVVDQDRLLVSRFRSAETLVIGAAGEIVTRGTPPPFQSSSGDTFSPAAAYRMVPLPGGGAAVLHQRGMDGLVSIGPGGWAGGACGTSIVHSVVTFLHAGGALTGDLPMPALPGTAIPVDVAISTNGERIAIVGAGSRVVWMGPVAGLESAGGSSSCWPDAFTESHVEGHPVAAAFHEDLVLVQTREPAALTILRDTGQGWASTVASIGMPAGSVSDAGHDLFHTPPNGDVACASCHPEGRDDGRTWTFTGAGQRRTQSLAGGVLATAPFHWSGDLEDMNALVYEVLVSRMGAVGVESADSFALGAWLDALPRLPSAPTADEAAADRGAALFSDVAVGCAACHAGERLTNNQTLDVGTGGAFQVPSLRGAGSRAPYMHDGCAATLMDRLTDAACGGGDAHGKTSHLTQGELRDLVAYLETL